MGWPTSLELQGRCYVEQTEPWKADHIQVMKNHDEADRLREAAAFGVFFLQRIKLLPTDTFEQSLAKYCAYLNWHKQTESLVQRIEVSESKNFPVDGADRLVAAFDSVNAMQAVYQNRCSALKTFIAGRGMSLEDFANAI